MMFRQLFDPATSTYTYLLADPEAKEAILIDPVREQVDRDVTLLRELGFRLLATLETHVHADHITGAWLLKQQLGSKIMVSIDAGVEADRLLGQGDAVRFGRYAVEARLTPGHTNGCISYLTSDRKMLFSGDALLIHGSGRTDFQQGDARKLFRSVWDQILSLPDDTLIYPGHDYKGRTVTTVREEKLYNPRLGMGRTEDEFVEIMENLGLAYPQRIDVALPANLNLGRLEGDAIPEVHAVLWDDVKRSVSGVRHVDPSWVFKHNKDVRMIDVRQPDEFHGPLGRVEGSELVPLDTLLAAADSWDKDEPLVVICRSSGRSDRAALELERLGFQTVASMVGGMLAWNQQNLRAAVS